MNTRGGTPWFLLALLLAAGSLSCAESQDERVAGRDAGESATLARLDPGALPALRDSFNAADDRPRILVMLSPT
jgi:hypothetical protein